MPNHLIRRVIVFGALTIMGIVLMQGYWLKRNYDLKDFEFNQTVENALYQVAQKIAAFNKAELPKHGLIQRHSSNCYAVNINDNINKSILEDYLLTTFDKKSINADFEYAVYDCHSKEMVYGSYCKMNNLESNKKSSEAIPTVEDLTYYFVVWFPSRSSYLLSNMWQNALFSIVTILALLFFIYAVWIIIEQKKLSELQTDFINNMTHEFKTPISSIKIASDYIKKDKTILANSKLSKYADIISGQNERLNKQVENVLNLARLESDNFKLKKEAFDIKVALQNIVQSENLKISDGCIEAEFPKTATIINADKLHFSNVVYNILDNAVKYCQQAPTILLKCYNTVSDTILEITDNGIGISKEDRDKVFKKFYRVSTGNVHDVKGFGLGLYYVHNICKSHGWDISIDSDGGGSTFIIKIPKN